MPSPALSLILHAHLPYVRHAEQPDFLEEHWLFEALTECYLPLWRTFDRLVGEGVPFRLALSLSPTLLEMLDDPLLRRRYVRHLHRQLELADREVVRLRQDARFHPLAVLYRDRLARTLDDYDRRLGRDVVAAFAALRDAGVLELFTTAATHAYLPLHRDAPETIRAQIRLGIDRFARAFGGPPAGFWLPECGYAPGLEDELRAAGVRWFVVDAHGLLYATPRPRQGTSVPVACPNGVAAFARDPECARRVWSATGGYPGHPDHREFHRDIGFDLTPEQLGPCARADGIRTATGLKYWRVTGRTDDKQPYRPERATERAREQAGDFVEQCLRRADPATGDSDRPPLLVAPFDAELFGHWWFEGPQWLDAVIRRCAAGNELGLRTPSDYLEAHPLLQRATPAESSWGAGGTHESWLNLSTMDLWPALREAARAMARLAADVPPRRGGRIERAVRQAARHLLLAQASDWPFMIRNRTTPEFGLQMIRDQLARFRYLEQAVRDGRVDAERLQALEQLDPLFEELDYRWWGGGFEPRSGKPRMDTNEH